MDLRTTNFVAGQCTGSVTLKPFLIAGGERELLGTDGSAALHEGIVRAINFI
jgi:hypothetical protein